MKNKTKYYHCSHIPHKVGSVVHTISEYGVLFMTNNPKPHYTLVDNEGRNNDIKNQKLYCYQVLPLGVVKRGRCWDELTTTIGFEIVRSLGECARNNTFSGVDKNGRTMIFGKKRKKKRFSLKQKSVNNWKYDFSNYKSIRSFSKKEYLISFVDKKRLDIKTLQVLDNSKNKTYDYELFLRS